MDKGEPFSQRCVASAEEFLDALRPSHPPWSDRPQLWGFRGQADAIWQLVPAALRPEFQNYLSNEGRARCETKEPANAQACKELLVFEEFAKLADQVGLYVPGIEHLLSEEFALRQDAGFDRSWPFAPEFVEGFAIAQHHGTPTRLLDFTYNPLVAAYFAAYDRCAKEKEGTQFESMCLSVWAVNLLFLENAWQNELNRRIRVVEVPTSRNLFLNAQRGFFIYHTMPDWPPKPIDEVIRGHAEDEMAWQCVDQRLDEPLRCYAKPVMQKLNLLASEAGRVLMALHDQERLSQAFLMPTLDNVVRTSGFMRDLRAGM